MANFKAQLGRADHPGLASQTERLKRIVQGRNPYVTGRSLPPDSPVFFGRERELSETLGVLRRPDEPGSVSVVGERRFGKSSFLNQVYRSLGAEPGLVSIHASTQNWSGACPAQFFAGLYRAILSALDGTAYLSRPDPRLGQQTQPSRAVEPDVKTEVADFSALGELIRPFARTGLRFVLLLDELEGIAGAEPFDVDFFGNLRALGEQPDYRFGYLISSRRPLKELCGDHRIAASAFWNIFGFTHYIGLLDESQARRLCLDPLELSLPDPPWLPPTGFWPREIAPLTGRHPALIQMVLSDLWNARAMGYEPNRDRIRQGLRDYLEDLWSNRHGKEEWRVLIQSAYGSKLEEDYPLLDLRLRGLIGDDGRPLCDEFARLIPELMPKGLTLAEALARLEKGGETANALLETLERLARSSGRLYRAFQGRDEGHNGDKGS